MKYSPWRLQQIGFKFTLPVLLIESQDMLNFLTCFAFFKIIINIFERRNKWKSFHILMFLRLDIKVAFKGKFFYGHYHQEQDITIWGHIVK